MMRTLLFVGIALAVSACATGPEPERLMGKETVRLEPTGELALKAGDYVDVSGFSFTIGFEDDATDLSTPDSVTWSIGFQDYCRDRDSWVQSVLVGPDGQVWRGYRVAVPAGPDHPQHWSSGGNGTEAYGGPANPGLLEAVAHGGQFILAVEDDEGERWNAVKIDTLTLPERNRLFAAQPASGPREEEMLVVAVQEPPPAAFATRPCP